MRSRRGNGRMLSHPSPASSRWRAPVALGLIGGMANFALHGLVDNSYFLPDLAVLFWLSFAILGLASVKTTLLSKDVPSADDRRAQAQEVTS